MIRVYYKSDYKIRETFTTQAGVVIDPRNFNFEFVFIAGKENTFTCSHTIGAANEWVNCVYDSENNAVLCMLDNHNLLPGRLKRELTIEEPDSDFPDGKLDYVTYKAYEIELVETPDGDSIYDIYDDETIISGNISSAILSQILHNVDVKDNIKDADELNYLDSGNGFGIVKTTWLNIKAKFKAYFDTIYASITHNHEPVQVTYAELYALKQSNNLTPGQVYEITDYVTTYKQPISGSSLSGEVEPLLVTAITNNSLHIKAKSTIYPLHEIWYNIENIQEIAYGSTKGFIYRRKDEKNNDIGFDFMNVKFRRWQVTGNAWEAGIIYAKKSVVKKGNYLYISTIDNNVGIDPDVNNTTIADLDSYYWIRCNFPDLSYVSCTPDGNISPGALNLTFAVTGLYEDYLMFSTPEIYAMSKNNFINNDWHQNSIGYNMFKMNNTVFMNNVLTNVYGSYSGVNNNVLQGDVQCNTILSTFQQNHISTTFYYLIISDIFDNNIIQSHFRHSFLNGGVSHIESLCWEVGRSIFGGRITSSNFANKAYYDNIFAKDIDCVSFLKDGRNSQFLNKISYCDIYRIDYDIFERELNNVTIKTFNQYNTIKAKLTDVIFEDNISYLKTGTNNIKDVIFGKNIANADLTTLVYPTTHCRIETVEGTPDKLCIKYLNADGRQCYSIVGLDASVIETGVYETETNKEADIETYKESTTKYPTLKGLYDWAVAKFLLATKLVTSWSGTPSDENIPSEKLVYDELVDLDANKLDKNAADLLLGAKEDITNKSSNVDTDKTSTTKYANVKAIYDWAVGKFIDLSKIVTTWTATTLDTNIPSEKLVKDSLNGKQDALTFSTDIETDKASTTKISAIKTFYDWAVAKFLLATKLVTSWSGTPSNENIPSEKLVYDELVDLDDNKLEYNTVINSLDTEDKTLNGAINEVNAIAKGAANGETFATISALVTDLNTALNYPYGRNLYVVDTEVPDFWISAIAETSVPYTYSDDATFLSDMAITGSLQVGLFIISELETQKVDLTDYYTKSETDGQIASATKQIHTGVAVTGTGTGISATVLGSKEGDYYKNTTTSFWYIATAPNTWDYKGSDKGIQGEKGEKGDPLDFSNYLQEPATTGGEYLVIFKDIGGTPTPRIMTFQDLKELLNVI